MKKLLAVAAAWLLCVTLFAQEQPLWLRHCAISPDGQTIAFAYKGDLWTVSAQGGRATQLTTNPAYDGNPVWSPNGLQLAFCSDRFGSMDIFIVNKEGGNPVRLTTHSSNEYPMAFKDDTHVLYEAMYMPTAEDMQFPSAQFPQVYEVSTQEGSRPVLFSEWPMADINIHGNQILFHDRKGYEDEFRKHHTSSITRDIWLSNVSGERSYQKLTSFKGEDRNPVWNKEGNAFYYLSEENGSFNVYKRNVKGDSRQQLTHFTKHPVRYLTAGNGTLCFSFDGEIYTMKEGGQPQKVTIQILSDRNDKDVIRQIKRSGATEIAVSPEGKEVAFIVRGDIYVTSVEYETTKQITNTPEQERNIMFAPDGRSLVYSSERNGLWQIYQATISKKEEKLFCYATDIKEERLTMSGVTSFEPQYSPDGKEVAFLENRIAIKVINLASRKVRTVMDGKFEYSYSDGDQWYQWSPDSKWILTNYIGEGGWNNKDMALVNASGNGEIHNLTESGYSDGNGKFVLDGKAILYESDREGYRSHGSWGAESDVYIMFLDLEAYERFRLSKEDLALVEEQEKADKEKKEKEESAKKETAKNKKKEQPKKDEKKEVKPLVFDFENARDRIVRLTVNSSRLGDFILSPKGDKLYYQASFEGRPDLWMHDLKENTTKIVMKGIGGGMMHTDKKGENIFLNAGGIKKVTIANGESKSVNFEAFFDYKPALERQYMFDHIWQQVKDKFYDTNIHGVDWEGYRTSYARFLPYINNNYDFKEMLSEMLGELNGSHTGARYYPDGADLPTAYLGVFYDDTYKGDGLKVKEIIAKSPLAIIKTKLTEGCVIEKIDGQDIKAGKDYFPLLEGKAGRKVRLSVYNPANKQRFDVTMKPISQAAQNQLLYERWRERNRLLVEKLSGGRLAYVHVKGMDSPSFRHVYSELLGRYRNKEAVIVDTRHNGGGWLHDDLATLLSGKQYQRFVAHGQYIGRDPFNKWVAPSCVLICEDNYSNAHGFPFVYKTLGIGKLIGAPVPGTMTAVWWETLIDPSIVFGIPQVGCMDNSGTYCENHQLEPDIVVYNHPEKVLNGEDEQLKAAVNEMLAEIK